MKADEIKETLLDYQKKLEGILGRFKRTRDAIKIGNSDESYLRKIVIELKDFLEDVFGKQNSYSANIINYYNNGQANFLNMPSYASVEQIRDVVSAVITRISRNPELLMKTGEKQSRADLKEPAKVTLPWLFHHVPVKYWISFFGLLLASFFIGIQASRLSLVQEILNLRKQTLQEDRTGLEPAESTNIFADVSKDGSILRSNNFPWKIRKSNEQDGNVLYTIIDRRGDATAISVVPDNPKYTVYQSYDGMVIKFTCAEEKMSDFTIKVKF